MRHARALTLMILLVLGTPSNAGEWEHAANTGSERLLLYTLVKEQPAGSLPAIVKLSKANGMVNRDEGLQLLSRKNFARPEIKYEHNINGGIPADEILLGGLKFRIDEDARAKEGVMVGGLFGHRRLYSLSSLGTLSVGASLGYNYSPDHDIGHFSANIDGCYARHLGRWKYVDLCLAINQQKKPGQSNHVASTRISGSKYLSSALGSHEVKVTLGSVFHQSYSKAYVRLENTTVIPDFGTASISFLLGQPTEGRHSQRWAANVKLGRPILGKRTTLSARYSQEGGSTIFGVDRKDDVFEFGLERTLGKNVSIQLSSEHRSSTISAYDGQQFGFQINLRPWTDF